MFPRFYQNLSKYIIPGKVCLIYGPRQTGKTTLLKNFLDSSNLKYKLDSGDNIRVQNLLSSLDFNLLLEYVKGYELYAIDEAQEIPNIGKALKILIDNVPGLRIIATGSSSFDISQKIGEPLTGRKITLQLYSFAQLELKNIYNDFELKEKLPEFLIYGGYPEVIKAVSLKEKKRILDELVNSYLLKDILTFEKVRNSKIILDLLTLLSYQVGSLVSVHEISNTLRIESRTVLRYLDILEKSFIIFRLGAFSNNLRSEVSKKCKYYFFDNGIRNTIIYQFNELKLRNDVGQLWENFVFMERQKYNTYNDNFTRTFFWRNYAKNEIDLIESKEGKIFAYELKYSSSRKNPPADFIKKYPSAEFRCINKDNYLECIV
jgi:uncharacterized protein